MIDLLEEEVRVYEVEDYRIPQLWDEEEVKWLSEDKIIVQRRVFKVIHTGKLKNNATITSPLPLSVEWHRLTNWRHAEELYTNYLSTWNKWKKKSLIPNWVIERVEKDG